MIKALLEYYLATSYFFMKLGAIFSVLSGMEIWFSYFVTVV